MSLPRGQLALRIRGTLTREEGRRLREDLQRGLHRGLRAFSLDLSEVDFVDSSGLAALVSLRKAARNEDFELSVETPSATLARLLEMTRPDGFVLDQMD
ncbi:MAG: STAS domain-containing protein [Myxococcota bacterium]